MKRRDVLRTALLSGISVLALDPLFFRAAFAQPLSSTLKLGLADVRFSALRNVNGTVEIGNSMAPGIQAVLPGGFPLALVRTDAATVSVSAKRCPHNGCQVDTFDGAKFVCPCHGSEFTGTGARISGPTPGPLDTYPAVLAGDILTITDLPGDGSWVLTSSGNPPAPATIALYPASPNPFDRATTIRYDIVAQSHVVLEIHDDSGRLVSRLVDGQQSPGVHACEFQASRIPAGTYLVTLRAGSRTESQRIVRVK